MPPYSNASLQRLRPYESVPSSIFERQVLKLTGLLLASLLVLQRFGIPFGAKPISIVGPIGFAIALYGLARGLLAIDRTRLRAFLMLAGWIAVGMTYQYTHPNLFGAAANLPSLAQFLALTSFGCLSFAAPVDEHKFFALVNRLLSWIAIAGIAQFLAQLVGIRIFQFTGLLPSNILYESYYNLAIPVGVGDLMKANGFFLIEPSVFSQFMAVGLIIEFLTNRRPANMLLFLTGLLLSFSGTGWLVLGSFLISAPFGLGRRGAGIVMGMLLLLGAAVVVAMVVAPDLAGALGQRSAEFSTIGTSGNMRFVTPFWLVSEVLHRAPYAWLTGIGSGASEALYLPYLYNVNTPVKVLLEYGLPALVAYLAIFLCAVRTPAQRALVVPLLMLFLVAGGYQQFPPVLFFVLLMMCIAQLRPAQAAQASAERPHFAPAPEMIQAR